MNCNKVRPELSDYRDDMLSADRRIEVADHLKSCGDCRHELAAIDSIATTLRRLAPGALAEDKYAALAAIADTPVETSPSHWDQVEKARGSRRAAGRILTFLSGAAASAAVAFGFGGLGAQQQPLQ